jgi:hypothetical protein
MNWKGAERKTVTAAASPLPAMGWRARREASGKKSGGRPGAAGVGGRLERPLAFDAQRRPAVAGARRWLCAA